MTDAGGSGETESLYEKYMLHHPADVRGCLRQLIDKRCVLHVGALGAESAVSAALAVDGASLWIDLPRGDAMLQRLLHTERLRFESAINRITVRFMSGPATLVQHDGRDALHVPLPEKVMHLQRREYVRREPLEPVGCELTWPDASGRACTVRARIADIGGGGLAMLTSEDASVEFEVGDIIPGVLLTLPEPPTLNATLRVQHISYVDRGGRRIQRAGCEFVDLSAQDQARLMRYVMHLDRLHAVRLRERGQ
ncbi:MAG TPA: flagellar regulator YcgR PilZN domain-containing protein [Lysobacter sp.]|nr:flagellar regulator YcgR PilZN domain-containing protein [Lysobacter sp.]